MWFQNFRSKKFNAFTYLQIKVEMKKIKPSEVGLHNSLSISK